VIKTKMSKIVLEAKPDQNDQMLKKRNISIDT